MSYQNKWQNACRLAFKDDEYMYKWSQSKTLDGHAPPYPNWFFFNAKMLESIKKCGSILANEEKEGSVILPVFFGYEKIKIEVKIKVKKEGKEVEELIEKIIHKPSVYDFADVKFIMVSGAQGGGKTNGITQLLCSMFYFSNPEILKVHILDKKGDFRPFQKIANFYTKNFEDVLEKICNKRAKKQAFLEQHNQVNINEYNELFYDGEIGSKPMEYDVVVIDDFGALCKEKEIADRIINLVELGRSAGVFLILISQRIDVKVLAGRGRSNFMHNWSFSQRDAVNSKIAGVKDAHQLNAPGLSILNIWDSNNVVKTVRQKRKDIISFINEMECANITFNANITFKR